MTKKSNSDTFDGIVLASVKGGVAQIPFVGSFLAEYLELAHKRVEEKRLKPIKRRTLEIYWLRKTKKILQFSKLYAKIDKSS